MRGGFETAFAVAQQDRDVRSASVSDDEIGIPVAVHILDSDVVGILAAREGRVRRRSEMAMAVVEQDTDGLVTGIANDDVGIAVVIDVGDGYGRRTLADRDDDAIKFAIRCRRKRGREHPPGQRGCKYQNQGRGFHLSARNSATYRKDHDFRGNVNKRKREN